MIDVRTGGVTRPVTGFRINGQDRTATGLRLNGQARTTGAGNGGTAPSYTAAGVVAPSGWGEEWRAYRDGNQAVRREFVVFGDSTTYGSDGFYSYVQQVRKRAVLDGLVDGGKGIFGGGEADMIYDAPEVRGIVSGNFTAQTNSFDSLVGQYYLSDTSGQTLNLRARSTAFRLWFVAQGTSSFTYSINGGSAVAVNANNAAGDPRDRFVYVQGLAPNTTHDIVVTNTSGLARVALAPINESGFAVQKQATSGATVGVFFHGGLTDYTGPHNATRYQAPMGLLPTVSFDGTGPDSPTSADGYIANNVFNPQTGAPRPILAMFNLGFNDLGNQTNSDFTLYLEGIRKFAAVCRAAGCDGIVSTGNLPVSVNWPTYGAALYEAYQQEAAAQGLAFIDMWEPFGGALDYTGGTANPHLTRTEYEAQGDYLWDALLAV